MNEIEKVKLSGGLEKTTLWVWMENSQLKVEFYDFSQSAQEMFGNDIAYTITVNQMDSLFSIAKQDETSLIQWLEENFKRVF